ncbi:MAG: DUF6600 domain-containing protein [Acidobacteriota bacterium]
MKSPTRSLLLAALLTVPVLASAADDLTSLSYISYLERYATIRPASGEESYDAVVNMPVLAGDRLETARGARLEVQLSDGCTLWVDEFTTVDFDALAYSRDTSDTRTAIFLNEEGNLAIEIPSTALGSGTVRLDTPAGTLFLSRPGLFRVSTLDGALEVAAHQGLAELPSGLGSALLRGGQQARIDDEGEIDTFTLAEDGDDFWAWVLERRAPQASGETSAYVDRRDASRAYVLDSYGDWIYVPTVSSYMWRPHVPLTWVPYSSGRWVWTPVGWTWIPFEPWGWYPFHYGSWYWDVSVGWVWGYDPVWGPAWVHWIHYPGYIGWCPRGYYDWHYGHHPRGGPGHGNRPGFPERWRSTAFDFSGHVRLGRVDQRPWTMVPTEHFTSSRIERVRIDPGRLIRGGEDGRTGVVRSGPLRTERPGSSGIASVIEPAFDSVGHGRVRDLSGVLGRSADGRDGEGAQLRPTRTGEMVGRVPGSDTGRSASERAHGTTRTLVRPSLEESRPSASEGSSRGEAPSGSSVRRGTVDTRSGVGSRGNRGSDAAPPPTRGTTRGTSTTAPSSGPTSGTEKSAPRSQVRSSSPSGKPSADTPSRSPSSSVRSAPPSAPSRPDPPKRQTTSYQGRQELAERLARAHPRATASRGATVARRNASAVATRERAVSRAEPTARPVRTSQAVGAGRSPAASRSVAAPRNHATAASRTSAPSRTVSPPTSRSSPSTPSSAGSRSGNPSSASSGKPRSR